MDQPATHSHRRHAAPDASSSPALPSPPPPPHHHLPLPLPDARPPPPPPSLPVPSALLPPKKRLFLQPPRKAATPIPSPPPSPPQSCALATPVPSPETLALPAPSPLPPVADSGLLTPPPPPLSEEDAAPSARPIPAVDTKQPSTPPPAPDAAPPPPPPPVSEEDAAPSARPIPAVDPKQPSAPPPAPDAATKPPPLSEEDEAPSARPIPVVDPKQPSTPPPAPDAATKPVPTWKVRKVVRKIIVKKIVPKGTFAARKAAAEASASDGAANFTGESTVDKPANDHNVATDGSVGKEQSKIVLAHRPVTDCNAFSAPSALGGETPNNQPKNDQHATTDDSVDKEQNSDESVLEELARDCNAVAMQAAATGSLKSEQETPTGKRTNDNQDIPAARSEDKEQDVNETTVEKPATNSNAVVMREASCKEVVVESLTEQTLARKPEIDCDARVGEAVGISERQRKSMKEVFVGGLDRDAKEEDVRAVFGKAGEITQVRMIMDSRTRRNKGYCFVQYREAAQAKNAIAKFGKVKICGKFCRTAAPVGNDRISPGNINKKWKKEDVKSVFVEEIPSSWGQAKLTEIFKNYGKIEHVFLSGNTQSSEKSACACIKYMTHEAAILCLESFDKEELTENGSKVNIKVSLSKPVQRSKQNEEEHTFCFSENVKTVGKTPIQDRHATYSGKKRPCSTLDDYSFDRMRSHSRPRHGSRTSTTSTLSDNVLAPATTRSPLPFCHDTNRFPEGVGSYYGVTRSSISSQIRQVGAHQLLHPYGRRTFPKI